MLRTLPILSGLLALGCVPPDDLRFQNAYVEAIEDLSGTRPGKGVCVSSRYFTSPDSAVDARLLEHLAGLGFRVLEPGLYPDTGSILIGLSTIYADSLGTFISPTLIESYSIGNPDHLGLVFESYEYRVACGAEGCGIQEGGHTEHGDGGTAIEKTVPRPRAGSK